MKKTLRTLTLALFAMLCGAVSAQDVVLDFSKAADDWGIPTVSTKDAAEYTNGTYTVTFCAASSGYKANSGYVLFGKKDAYITLPAFDFAVQTVELVGNSGASASTLMNLFVGNDAISTQTTGCQGVNKYEVPEAYQTGHQFTLKVLSSHNGQVSRINIYKVGSDVPQPVDISNTVETAYSVSKAIDLIDAGEGLTTKVYVAGKITEVKEISTSYGNATYTISDGEKSLIVYRGFDFKGAKFTSEDALKVDDEVVVYGALTKYKEDYELAQGNELVLLNGQGFVEKPLELVGDGTQENPYTVADVIALHAAQKDPADKVWVKGVIGGCYANNAFYVPSEEKAAEASNIALQEGDKTIPVQLPVGNTRNVLNLLNNPYNLGLDLLIQGQVTAYFSVAGVKSPADYVINQPEEVVPEGYILVSVSDFEAVWQEKDGVNNVVLTFTTPTKMLDINWEPAPLPCPITKVVISRSPAGMDQYEEIATIEHLGLGQNVTYTDSNLALGSYDYQAFVYVGETMEDWGSMTSIVVGEIAADLAEEDFTATPGSFNWREITLEVTLPTLNSLGEELKSPITKVVLSELNNMTWASVPFYVESDPELLQPGTTFQYIIPDAADGSHIYQATVYTAAGANNPASVSIFVGNDLPGMVQDLTVRQMDNCFMISWNAPTTGLNGGNMGDEIWYNVYRGTSEYDPSPVVVAKGIKETFITDNPPITADEAKFVYIVYAESEFGLSYPTVSDEFIVGNAAQLPFYENFDVVIDEYGNTTTEHSSWSKTEYTGFFSAWQLGQNVQTDEGIVTPHNGNGLLYAYYNQWMNNNCSDTYTSGNIDFSAAEAPTMTFWLYDFNTDLGDMELHIQTSANGGDFQDAESISLGSAQETGWREVTVSLDNLKSVAKGKVRFLSISYGYESFPVIIDEIAIVAGGENEDAIEQISEAADLRANMPVFNLQGQRVTANTKGIIIIGGKKYLNK